MVKIEIVSKTGYLFYVLSTRITSVKNIFNFMNKSIFKLTNSDLPSTNIIRVKE